MRSILIFIRNIFSEIVRKIVKSLPDTLLGTQLRRVYYGRRFHKAGANFKILQNCEVFEPHLIEIGKNSSIARYCELNPGPGTAPCLVIGDDTYVGPYVFFRTSNHKFDDPDTHFIEQGHEEKGIKLGDSVLVGAHVIFLPGARVGSHSIIAAGSVVSMQIPPYSIVAGNPARVVKLRKPKDSHVQ